MRTIALLVSDNYAPKEGVIYHHNKIINEKGFVWYGKFGNKISRDIVEEQLNTKDPKFLLIKSGSVERYWVHFDKYLFDSYPDVNYIPEYYRETAENIHCWFRVIKFERAERDILSKCFVISSGDMLSNASKHSMNPYFKIEFNEFGGKNGKKK